MVLPDRAGNEMDVIWLLSGAVIQTLHLGNIGGSVAAPLPRDWRGTLMCDMDGESLYVTCTRGARGNNVPNPFTGQPGLAGVSVQKFNVRTGKREWQSDIDSEGTTTYFSLALVIGRGHVMFSPGGAMRNDGTGTSEAAKVVVIDSSTGKMVATLDPQKSKSDQAQQTKTSQRMTPAVMTNGRVIMENVDGVTVYGSGN